MSANELNEVTAPEAAREFDKLNEFGRTEWDPRWFQAPPVFVYSLFWQEIWRRDLGSLGAARIPACAPGKPYSEPVGFLGYCADGGYNCQRRHVHRPAIPGMYRDEYRLLGGDGQMGWRPIRGEAIADAIIGTGTQSPNLGPQTTSYAWYGVFRAQGPEPTRQEVAEAREKLQRFCTMNVRMADRMAASGPAEAALIQPIHRESLDWLHEKRAWANLPSGKDLCAQCQEPLLPGTKKHTCGYLVDPEWLFAEGQIDRETFQRVVTSRGKASGKTQQAKLSE